MRGKTAIAQASANYEGAGAADAPSLWDTLVGVTDSAKRKVVWGIGLASAGALLTGIGGLLAIPPRSPATSAPAVSLLVTPGTGGMTVGLSFHIPGDVR